VQQAEAVYGYLSAHPIFVEWVEDPVHEMELWKARGTDYYFVTILACFVFQVLVTLLVVARFSYIGRRPRGHPHVGDMND